MTEIVIVHSRHGFMGGSVRLCDWKKFLDYCDEDHSELVGLEAVSKTASTLVQGCAKQKTEWITCCFRFQKGLDGLFETGS